MGDSDNPFDTLNDDAPPERARPQPKKPAPPVGQKIIELLPGDKAVDAAAFQPIPLPNDQDVEAWIIGGLMIYPRVWSKVGLLKPEHFYYPLHQKVWAACQALLAKGITPTPPTIVNMADSWWDELIKNQGGNQGEWKKYLVQMIVHSNPLATFVVNAEDYARCIYDLFLRRQSMTAGLELYYRGLKPPEDSTQVANITEQSELLRRLVEDAPTNSHTIQEVGQSAMQQIEEAFKAGGRVIGVPTSFKQLDDMLGGFGDGRLVIVAGKTGMGKTSFALSALYEQIKLGKRAWFYSMEMTSEELLKRLMAMDTGINSRDILQGTIGEGDAAREAMGQLIQSNQRLSGLPLTIYDNGQMTVPEIRRHLLAAGPKGKPDIVYVDYLQLLKAITKNDNRVQQVTEISRDLKLLAKDLGIPVVALSQLSRSSEQRDNPRPILADLRDSGSIEQDADQVLFIYREEYHLAQKKPTESDGMKDYSKRSADWDAKMQNHRGEATILIAKNRHGPTQDIDCKFDGATMRFLPKEDTGPFDPYEHYAPENIHREHQKTLPRAAANSPPRKIIQGIDNLDDDIPF